MRTKILIAIALVVVLAIGGGGYWYFKIRPKEVAAAKKAPKKKLFASVKPMVVGISGGSKYGLSSGTTYLQIGFQFQTVKKKAIADFDNLKPAIRGHIMSLLLDAKPAILNHKQARNQMKKSVLKEVNKIIVSNDPKFGKHVFDQVYITNFVTQSS